MHNITIYLSSRNNYSLLEEFIQRNPKLSNYYFVNVDDHSEPEQQKLGKHICEKHGIPFVINRARGLQNAATFVGEILGYGGEASQADATLKILGEKLTAQVPRFEGPQSDKDTAAYRVAAGDIGNANKPIATRIAAIKTMIELNKKYYPNGDWDSIDIGGPVQRQYSPYVPTVAQDIYRTATGQKASYSPQEFRKTLSPQDQAAFDFVRKNPNHKDTPAIKRVLGIQ